jgi:hypothetical protein
MINIKLILSIGAICFLMLSSCSEEETLFPSTGTTSMDLNGMEWSASNYASYSPSLDLYHILTSLRTEEGLPIREFSIGFIPSNTDSVFIQHLPLSDTSPVALFDVVDVDSVCEGFRLSPLHENLLLVDSINAAAGYIAGRFDFVFVKQGSLSCQSGLPDTLRMEDGRFESVVIRR